MMPVFPPGSLAMNLQLPPDFSDDATRISRIQNDAVAQPSLGFPLHPAQNNTVALSSVIDTSEYTIDRDGRLVIVTSETMKTSPIGKEIKGNALISPTTFGRIVYLIVTGKFLQLGEHSGQTNEKKENLVAENNTVALASALMLTIQYASLFMHNDNEWDSVTANWGNATNTSTWGDVMEEAAIPTQMSLIFLQLGGLMYAIMMLLCLNELSGEAEVERLINKRGVSMSGAFVCFNFASLGYVIWCLVWCIAYCKTWTMIYAGLIFMIVFLGIYTFVWPNLFGMFQDLHNIKAETLHRDGPDKQAHDHAPVVLTRHELGTYLMDFIKVLPCQDASLLSPEVFESYVLFHQKQSGAHPSRRRLSYMTSKALNEMVDAAYGSLYPEVCHSPSTFCCNFLT